MDALCRDSCDQWKDKGEQGKRFRYWQREESDAGIGIARQESKG